MEKGPPAGGRLTNNAYIIAAYGICLGSLFLYWVHVHFEARNLQRKDIKENEKT